MKVNKTLFMFFAVIAISFYLNIQPTTAQSMTSASMGSMGMDADRDDDQYWQGVEGKPFQYTGQTRTYYLGADEVVWNFVPDGYNAINGTPFEGNALTYTQNGPERIGPNYIKCLYRAYTSDKFDELIPRPEDEEYLGFLGPIIRAEVGDIIKVVFRNGCRIPASVHPHGVFYGKADEGAPYNDGTPKSEKYDDIVHPGDTYTYTWEVPERAGPNSGDGSSVMWMYHSHTTEIADVYAGLTGPMAITRKGKARADGSPKDVSREIFVIFEIIDENQSPYLDVNFAKFAQCPAGTPAPVDDDDFQESNLKHSINGHIFGNGPLITINKGERVRWYLMSMGTEDDLHTPHWHGNVVTVNMMRMDMVSLLPAEMVVADMVPDNEGIWLFHCHVGDHIKAGMLARYQVNAD